MIRSSRVFATGVTGSGKTFRLRTMWAERFPRVLAIDVLGREWPQWPGAQVVYTLADVWRALQRNASRTHWRVVWVCDPSSPEVDMFFERLIPPPGPDQRNYVTAVGGFAVLCDEIADVVPNVQKPRPILRAWRWGRHVGLSMLVGTQRLPDVHKTVTAQSDVIMMLQQHEPRDLLVHLAKRVPPHVLKPASTLSGHAMVLYDANARRAWWYPDRGPPVPIEAPHP